VELTVAPAKQHDEVGEMRKQLALLQAELQHHRETQQTGEAHFRLLADAAPVMIWMSGPDALFTYVNRAWLEFRGRTLDEEAGEGWTEALHPDDRDLCLETYRKAFVVRQPFRMRYRVRRADGEYSWVEDAGVPRYESSGAFAGFMGSAIDITDRKRGISAPDQQTVRLVFSLTERERQVLVLIAQGNSTKETASQLGISYKTADSHRSRILEKLGVHETASMVRYAIRAGLIEP
jgi:PAS domain S-box-containing protein